MGFDFPVGPLPCSELGQKDHVRLIGNDFVDLLKRIGLFYVDSVTTKEFYQKHFPEEPTRFRNSEYYLKTYDGKGRFFVLKDTLSKQEYASTAFESFLSLNYFIMNIICIPTDQ